jgi:hypothetical protein
MQSPARNAAVAQREVARVRAGRGLSRGQPQADHPPRHRAHEPPQLGAVPAAQHLVI